MPILIHLDDPAQFSVYKDGSIRAHIYKRGGAWKLRRDDREAEPGYTGVDVSRWILQHDDLEPVIERHLSES